LSNGKKGEIRSARFGHRALLGPEDEVGLVAVSELGFAQGGRGLDAAVENGEQLIGLLVRQMRAVTPPRDGEGILGVGPGRRGRRRRGPCRSRRRGRSGRGWLARRLPPCPTRAHRQGRHADRPEPAQECTAFHGRPPYSVPPRAMYASTSCRREASDTAPLRSTTSWKVLMSNLAPSAFFASSRRRRISR